MARKRMLSPDFFTSKTLVVSRRESLFTIQLNPMVPLTEQCRRFMTNPAGIWLYRFLDDCGQLLYIGITTYPAERWTQHRRTKTWWPEVRRVTLQRCSHQTWRALAIEKAAIKAEKPRHNKRSAVV